MSAIPTAIPRGTLSQDICLRIVLLALHVFLAIVAFSFGWSYFSVPSAERHIWEFCIFLSSAFLLLVIIVATLSYYIRQKREERVYGQLGYAQEDGAV